MDDIKPLWNLALKLGMLSAIMNFVMKSKSNHLLVKSLGLIALSLSPLAAQDAEKMEKKMDKHSEMRRGGQNLSKLVAVINPVGDSNVKGTVVFERMGDGVKVTANVGGFEPNTKHGFHIHEFGDLGSPDATSAGGHFNPDGHDHALEDAEVRHNGDLGNLTADGDGHATLTLTVKNIKLGAGKMGILGRAVIIHAKEDDGGQPTGNAGDRIAAGVIGISKDAMSGHMPGKKNKMKGMDKPEERVLPTEEEVEETATDLLEKAGDSIENVGEEIQRAAE